MSKIRRLYFYKQHFETFYQAQNERVKKKILWTLRVITELEQVPEHYFKHLKNTSGLYEIRVSVGNNIYRIFCFFDEAKVIIVGHGFQKKTQKTPKREIEKAERLKKQYYAEKRT